MVEEEDVELLIPLGEAEVKREGSDVTIICYAQTVPLALATAERLENEEEISAEVLDLRSIKPLDMDEILNSVSKTHRVVIVEQDRPFCGVGAEVSYRIQKEMFDGLDAPILRVAQEDVPMPYNERLEHAHPAAPGGPEIQPAFCARSQPSRHSSSHRRRSVATK